MATALPAVPVNKTAQRLETAKALHVACCGGNPDTIRNIVKRDPDAAVLFILPPSATTTIYAFAFTSYNTAGNEILLKILLEETDLWEVKSIEIFKAAVERGDVAFAKWLLNNKQVGPPFLRVEDALQIIFNKQTTAFIPLITQRFGWKQDYYELFIDHLCKSDAPKNMRNALLKERDIFHMQQVINEAHKTQAEAAPPPPKKQKIKQEPIEQNGH